jgi:hypothetical protein
MRAVRTLQKYKCDFCKRRSVKSAMERHEKVCFRNPNRFCEECQNTGKVEVEIFGYGIETTDCYFCSRLDKEKLEAIEKYEADLLPVETKI